MPPRGVKSAKRARQYEKIKASATKSGRSATTAKRIAAATVNKQRREAGETAEPPKRSRKTTRKSVRPTASGQGGARKTGARKTSARRTAARKMGRRSTAQAAKKKTASKRQR